MCWFYRCVEQANDINNVNNLTEKKRGENERRFSLHYIVNTSHFMFFHYIQLKAVHDCFYMEVENKVKVKKYI